MIDTENTQEKAPKELDLSTSEWTSRLANAEVYAKKAIVQAREAVPGETITTTLADGTVETTNTAGENTIIITNPGGEEYIIGAEKFAGRYESTGVDGEYRATGMARAVKNPTGGDIQVMAPWGELQFGGPDALIATVFDPLNPDEVSADRYIIGSEEFKDTYAPYEDVYGSLEK
ncbi:MAG: PGDYG domain-containing protein [Candidatus Saccharimonadales bacterium]